MTFITLFSNEHGFVATDQHVFSAAELEPLTSVLDQAGSLTRRLVEQVNKEASACEAAREKGHAEGFSQGCVDASEKMANDLQQLQAQHQQAAQQLTDSCAQLAVDIVKKIAGNISTDEWLAGQAQQAAKDVVDQPVIKLRVHSSQVEAVRSQLALHQQSLIHSVVGDDLVNEQTCILDTGVGQIDICLDTQLSSVLSMLNSHADSASDPSV